MYVFDTYTLRFSEQFFFTYNWIPNLYTYKFFILHFKHYLNFNNKRIWKIKTVCKKRDYKLKHFKWKNALETMKFQRFTTKTVILVSLKSTKFLANAVSFVLNLKLVFLIAGQVSQTNKYVSNGLSYRNWEKKLLQMSGTLFNFNCTP